MQEIGKETRLTRREKEVRLWAAKGKTAWETAVILNISRTTVLSHLKNARIKLDTTNVAQTIAEAISRSEIPS